MPYGVHFPRIKDLMYRHLRCHELIDLRTCGLVLGRNSLHTMSMWWWLAFLVTLQGAAGALPVLSSARTPVALGDRRTLVGQNRGYSPPASTAVDADEPSSETALLPVSNNILSWGAMPFASVDSSNQTLSVHAPALHALAALPAPICVLSVAGPAHEGKSSWLNMFSHWLSERWTTVGGAGKDFKVGSSIFDAGTEGAWMRLFTGKGACSAARQLRQPLFLPPPRAPSPLTPPAVDAFFCPCAMRPLAPHLACFSPCFSPFIC